MWKLLVPLVALAALIVAAYLADPPEKRADFVFINRGDVATLDLQKMSWMQDLRVARILFEGLVTYDVFSREYRVKPAVAEEWKVSEDRRTYTFRLRENARWSNGKPVTADDFVYAWRRALIPEIGSDYVAQFQLIKGGKAFYDWRTDRLKQIESLAKSDAKRAAKEGAALWDETVARFENTVGVRAKDNGRTLEVELERPTPYFLDLCAFAVFYPVYPPLVAQYERPDPRTGRLDVQAGWTKPGTIVSNGPFVLTQWRFKRTMRFLKNPEYWNGAEIAVNSIEIPSVEDANAAVLSYNSGAVDWVSDVIPPYRRHILDAKRKFYDERRAARREWLARGGDRTKSEPADIDALIAAGVDPIAVDAALPADPRKNVHTFPAFGTYFLNFNCAPKLADGRDNPFRDPRVRRAFAMTVDKQRVAGDLRGVGERTTATLIPPNSITGYVSPKGLAFDTAAARQLLAEAGYPEGRGFPTAEILVSKDGGHDIIAQAVAKDWQDNLGVSVTVAVREVKVFRNDLKKQNFMISRAGWFGDYGDPTTFLEINRTGDGNNDRKYSSAVFDGLLDAAENEKDAAKRLAILSEAERVLIEDDLPFIPIFQYVQMYMFNVDEISGITSHPRQVQNLFLVDRLKDGQGSDRLLVVPPPLSAASPAPATTPTPSTPSVAPTPTKPAN